MTEYRHVWCMYNLKELLLLVRLETLIYIFANINRHRPAEFLGENKLTSEN